jgi:hypothetical protein
MESTTTIALIIVSIWFSRVDSINNATLKPQQRS